MSSLPWFSASQPSSPSSGHSPFFTQMPSYDPYQDAIMAVMENPRHQDVSEKPKIMTDTPHSPAGNAFPRRSAYSPNSSGHSPRNQLLEGQVTPTASYCSKCHMAMTAPDESLSVDKTNLLHHLLSGDTCCDDASPDISMPHQHDGSGEDCCQCDSQYHEPPVQNRRHPIRRKSSLSLESHYTALPSLGSDKIISGDQDSKAGVQTNGHVVENPHSSFSPSAESNINNIEPLSLSSPNPDFKVSESAHLNLEDRFGTNHKDQNETQKEIGSPLCKTPKHGEQLTFWEGERPGHSVRSISARPTSFLVDAKSDPANHSTQETIRDEVDGYKVASELPAAQAIPTDGASTPRSDSLHPREVDAVVPHRGRTDFDPSRERDRNEVNQAHSDFVRDESLEAGLNSIFASRTVLSERLLKQQQGEHATGQGWMDTSGVC